MISNFRIEKCLFVIGRDWLIEPLGNNPWWTIIVAVIPALLGTILIFLDQQITAVIVNRYNIGIHT